MSWGILLRFRIDMPLGLHHSDAGYEFGRSLMKQFFLVLLALAGTTFAQAEADGAKVQVINFTADWCPNCRVFDPRLHQAIAELNDPAIESYSFDLTITRTGSQQQKTMFWANLLPDMRSIGLGSLHKGFAAYPYTGYAVVVAADTKEPLVCFMGPMSVEMLKQQLKASRSRVANRPQGKRVPEGADCPPSYLS